MIKWLILGLAIFVSIFLIFDLFVLILCLYYSLRAKQNYKKSLLSEILLMLLCAGLWAAFILI